MRWIIKPKPDSSTVRRLSNKLGVDSTTSFLLAQRGIETYEEAKRFFRPELKDLHDPFLMKDMDKAVLKIEQAIIAEENILIYGDYDVDGTCSVAMMVRFLKSLKANVFYYQPHREKEGYGISLNSVEWATKNKINLIIALDCGIKDFLAAKAFKDQKIDLIICDHHNPSSILPNAYSILNPKQADCHYPFKDLCGCTVGLKLIQSYVSKFDVKIDFSPLYQLAAVATAADVVPLVNENRLIAHLGLQEINKSPIEPFSILFSKLKKYDNVNIGDLIFKIAPRINAAGRLETALIAAEFLISDSDQAVQSLNKIEIINDQRRELDELITNESLIELEALPKDRLSNVVFSNKWHKGVVGIVASRIIEHYYKPTIVLTGNDKIITGSARSVKGFDIYTVLENLKHYFVRFGGHKYAAGLSLKKENLEAFKIDFEKEVRKYIKKDDLIPKILIDTELSLNDLFKDNDHLNTPKIYRIIKQMEPFGIGNPKPVFLFKKLLILSPVKVVGEKHLKFVFFDYSENKSIDGIWFNSSSSFKLFDGRQTVNVVGTIDENIFRGNKKMQIIIKDVKVV